MARLAAGLGRSLEDALLPEKAGVGLFLTVLGAKSGQERTLVVLATNARQVTRLALSLRSAGLAPSQVDEVLLQLHPQAAPVPGLANLTASEARSMLSDAAPEIGG